MDQQVEIDLIRRAVDGDRDALERLLLAYYDRLSRRLARRVPDTLRAVTSEEDVLQQAFIAAFDAIGSFRPTGRWSFYRWLVTLAEHRLQDAIRAHRAAKRGGGRAAVRAGEDGNEYDDLIDLLAGPRRTPSQSVARHEAVRAVHEALESLAPDHAEALALRYVRGLPVAEVAETMQRTERAIHNLCYRGLREIHAVMGGSSTYLTRK
ncbi:MAG: RNA polymerase sigma factor [Planctomycetota bacterium]|jgi:RNA polymerase sigma-70 factor (ECF subfamily)